jgi:hypothetical protein
MPLFQRNESLLALLICLLYRLYRLKVPAPLLDGLSG